MPFIFNIFLNKKIQLINSKQINENKIIADKIKEQKKCKCIN